MDPDVNGLLDANLEYSNFALEKTNLKLRRCVTCKDFFQCRVALMRFLETRCDNQI